MLKVNSEEQIIGIGGMAGSGTRVLSKILQKTDTQFGFDLNRTEDDVVFSRIMNIPSLLSETGNDEVSIRLKLFRRLLTRQGSGANDLLEHIRLTAKNPHASKRLTRTLRMVSRYFSASSGPSKRYAWKEPCASYFLKDMLALWPDFKYIHLIRHGLDMALSSNKGPLGIWGDQLIGEEVSAPEHIAMFKIWKRINEDVKTQKEKHPNRVMIIRLEDLCSDPKQSIAELFRFLNIQVGSEELESISKIPVLPNSSGRYKNENPDMFPAEFDDALRNFGYEN